MAQTDAFVSCAQCGAMFLGMTAPSHTCLGASSMPAPLMGVPLPTLTLTLRDYFAAQALAGMLADSRFDPPIEKLAKGAYEAADAMLKAREQA